MICPLGLIPFASGTVRGYDSTWMGLHQMCGHLVIIPAWFHEVINNMAQNASGKHNHPKNNGWVCTLRALNDPFERDNRVGGASSPYHELIGAYIYMMFCRPTASKHAVKYPAWMSLSVIPQSSRNLRLAQMKPRRRRCLWRVKCFLCM